mmetsp:Transcript_11781/g.13575  ORF Transcript_11781/g.13575 Transcript_11781/m.13575 type:complete len:433 (+) Transcript_11781:75-1373(+)
MGIYLSQPVTEKHSVDGIFESGKNKALEYGISDMQGWRQSMEDAYVATPNIPRGESSEETSIFAVFDGHGGKEVAKFCSEYFVKELLKLPDFTEADYSKALIECFHKMDDMLMDSSFTSEIKRYQSNEDNEQNPASEAVECENEGAGSEGVEDSPSKKVESPVEVSNKECASEDSTDGVATGDNDDVKKSITASVKRQLDEAEAKGSLSKNEALDLMMKMLKLKRLENETKDENQNGLITEAGCTAIVALLVNNHLFVANAGDSRGVLCSNGEAIALSEDHKPTDSNEHARIKAAGGFVNEQGRVNGNLNLSRAIGDLRYKGNDELDRADQIISAQPDVRVFNITSNDYFFILACDGVWDIMKNDEIVDFVNAEILNSESVKASTIIEKIFDKCISEDPMKTNGLGGDNMTCILVFLRPVEEIKQLLNDTKT